MKNLKKYPKYQDSGFDWLGELPFGWTRTKINNFTHVVSQKGFPEEELLSVYRDYGVIIKSSRSDNHNRAGENLSAYKLVEPGYLVLNKMKTWQGSLGISNYRGIVSPAYITCKIRDGKFENGFLHYLLRSQRYIFQYNKLSYGVRTDQWDMRYEDFKNTPVFAPSRKEQKDIINFLDNKTGEIKQLISAKRKFVEILKEKAYKLAVNGFQEPSQVSEWEDNFPNDWKALKGKWIFKEIKIKNKPKEELLAVTQNRGVLPKSMCSESFVSPDEKGLLSQKLVLKESFVISLRSFQGGIEFSYYQGIVSPAYTVFVIKEEFDNERLRIFYKYFLKSKPFIELLNTIISGIRDGQNISFTDFSTLNIPLPDVKTQEAVFVLDKIIIEQEIKTKKEITLLKEYQQSLISEAVTGKIDVRKK